MLSILDERGDLTVTALAEADRCSQPTMSAQVSGLQQRGLLEKRPHATDARSSVVSLTPAGRVHYTTSDGRSFERSGALQENAVEFHVESAFISWPMMHVRQTYPLSIGNESIVEPWVQRLLKDAARRRTADGPHRLRVALRGDTLFAAPGGPYHLREAQDGAGLVLVNPDEQR